MRVSRSSAPPVPMPRIGREAVVLGASMAGLLAAAVLAEAYDHVTLVERDELPGGDEPRRGVPQGRHAHVLLPRGADALDELFPGFLDELTADGGASASRLSQFHFELNGHLLSQDPDSDDNRVYEQSRPFLESHVLRRVRALPRVTVLDRHEVVGLRPDHLNARVLGATVAPRTTGAAERDLPADLVVAATGRNGVVGAWLTGMGYDAAPEEELRVDLKYATRRMRLDRALTGEVELLLVGPTAERPAGVGAFRQEHDTWVVTLAGFAGHHPPTEPEEWLAFAERFATPRFARALREGEALSEILAYRFPANLRRRYDRLDRFPDGLLVVGDAVCSFNPIYGQGMTVAALEALALRATLAQGTDDLARRFFKAAARPVGTAWQLAVGADLAMPEDVVPGPRPLPVRAVNAYLDRYQGAAETDPVLASHFLKVTGLDEPMRALFLPRAVGRVVTQRRRGRAREPLPVVAG